MKKRIITKKLFGIALPITMQYLTQFILSFTDTAFIGNYRTEGLSAITNAVTPYFMFLIFFFAIGQGTTILIAQKLGAGKKKVAKRLTESSFIFNQIISLIYFFFWMILGRYILMMIGVKGEILEMSWSYVRIISYYFLFFGISLSCSAMFEGIGRTMPIMITTIIRSAVNILLDWLLIFGNWGFPELGIEGAAYATFISQFIGTAVFVAMAFSWNPEFKIKWKNIIRPKFKFFYKSLKLGLPTGVEYLLFTAGQTVMLSMMNKINEIYTGIFGVLDIFIQFAFYLYLGLANASLNLVGKAAGANNWKEGQLTINLSIIYSLIVCVLFGVVYCLFPRQLMGIFMEDTSVVNQFYKQLYLVTLIAFPKSINVIIGSAIRASGNTKWMLYTQIPGTIIKISMAFLFVFTLKLGLAGIMLTIFVDEGWRSVINHIKYKKIFSKAIKKYSLAV